MNSFHPYSYLCHSTFTLLRDVCSVTISLCCFFKFDMQWCICTSVVTTHEGYWKWMRGMGVWKMNAILNVWVPLCVSSRGEGLKCWSNLVPQLFSFHIQQSLILRDSELSKYIRVIMHIVLHRARLPGGAHFSMSSDMLVGISLTLDGWVDGSEVCSCLTVQMVIFSFAFFSTLLPLLFFLLIIYSLCIFTQYRNHDLFYFT